MGESVGKFVQWSSVVSQNGKMGECWRKKIQVVVKNAFESEVSQRRGKKWHWTIEILAKNEKMERSWECKDGLVKILSKFEINERRREGVDGLVEISAECKMGD